MVSLLLAVIYLAFISLGLPDAMLGAAWPAIYPAWEVPVSYAGAVSFLIAGGTIVSSLLSERLIRRLGTGRVTAFSVGLTALALYGFSLCRGFLPLCLLSIPYGLGAGSVDAALNNYVAQHYKPRHMSWLHCFWGLGASAGPYIMGLCLTAGQSWSLGYRVVGLLQLGLTAALLLSLPLWKGAGGHADGTEGQGPPQSMRALWRVPGVKAVLAAMLCYCAAESTAGLWASSYLVLARGFSEERASRCGALFYLGITLGRFLSGFVTGRLGDRRMVRLGQSLAFLGAGLLLVRLGDAPVLVGLLLLGLGCAPVYPSLIHTTPVKFGADRSQAVIGTQMAAAYTGSTLVPPLFGLAAERVGIGLYPFFALVLFACMVLASETLYRGGKQGG